MAVDVWALTFGPLLLQRGGDWAGPQPDKAPPCCTKSCNSHPSTASIPIAVLLYNGMLLCGFHVPIKGLILLQGILVERGLTHRCR